MNTFTTSRPTKFALPRLEAPTVGDDGVLPHDQWNRDLRLEVPNSPDVKAGFTIAFTINGVSYGQPHTVTDAEEGNYNLKFPFFLRSTEFPTGNPQLSVPLNYNVYNPNTGGTSTPAQPFVLIFDKEPPGGTSMPYINFTPEQLQGVYPQSIVDGHFVANLSPWQGMAVGDVMTPWVSTSPPGDNPASGLQPGSAVAIDEDGVGRSVNVRFPEGTLKANGDTPQYFGYQLKDRLGNTSSVSPARQIPVHLQNGAVRPRSVSNSKRQPKVVRNRNDDLYEGTIEDLRPLDGRIEVSRLSGDVEFTVPIPVNPVAGNEAQLFINGTAVGAPVAVDPTGTDFVLTITAADFAPAVGYPFTRWLVDYSYDDPFSGDVSLSEKPLTVLIDRHAPGGRDAIPPAIAFTEDQLAGITEDKLDPTEDGLIVHLSAWNDEDIDDQVELWLGTGPAEADGNYLTALPDPVTDIGAGMDVVFPRADLEGVGVNPVYFGYRITDWAGNVSNLSIVTAIQVFLGSAPTNLLRPLIPDAAPYNPEDGTGTPPGTGLLTWTQANPVTRVRIPNYTNVAAGDRVYILWNTQVVDPVTVTQADIDGAAANGYLLEILMPFTFVQTGANTPVGYRVHPASGTPPVLSPLQYIRINLTTPGGPDPDPDPDTPEHENMRLPSALSTFAGSVPNIIPPEAYASPANVTIFRQGVDNQPIWLIGDVLQVIWGPPATNNPAPITIDVANGGANIVVPIPAAMIAANGTGTIKLSYTLTRSLDANNTVTTPSPAQDVIVQAPGEAPGGPNPLQLADFPESLAPIAGNPNRFIQRAVGLRGTTLRVPLLDAQGAPLANVAAGDFISVDFYGVDDPLDGPGQDNDPTKPIIPESRITVTDYVIQATDLTRGYYEVALPYSKTYFICRNLSVTKYSIRNAAGITKNAPDTLILFALNQAGGVCSLPTRQ
jgi:hypothetical protein